MPNDIANNMADTIHQLEEDRIMLHTQLTDLQFAYNNQMLELKEAKRLLKAAVEDIHSRDYCHGCIYENAEGKEQYLNCEYHNCFKWRYADEALKLIES